MKSFTQMLRVLMFALTALITLSVSGQSILNPADSVVTYNSAAAAGSISNPNQPAGGVIGKWIRTVRVSFSTTQWKCYVINGIPFRLIFPKSYTTAADGKVYPMLIFYHGAGEVGPVHDNELSMANGGQFFTNSVNNSLFDGYILIPQSPQNGWDPTHFDDMALVIKYMITNNKLNPFKIAVNGLSAGGGGTWAFTFRYPQYVSAGLPMSANNLGNVNSTNLPTYKFTRMWDFQGGLDTSPDKYTGDQVYAAIMAAGGNYKYTVYPTLGHGTWNTVWAEPNFWPFIDSSYASNPWTLFGQTAFCPGVAINVTIGVAPGFTQYQWRKDGVALGSTTNTITTTVPGTYDCRVMSNGLWSEWSRLPVVISVKQPTITPPIAISGLMSNVIPAPDNNGVTLQVPNNYVSYIWQKVGDSTTISSTNTLYVTTPAQYIVKVTELYGCSSSFSAPYTVASASGPNKPDGASALVASTVSPTSLLLNWSQNPTPSNNETGFEIYMGTKAGGPYKLTAIAGADSSKYTINGLAAGTKYYFIVRAVDVTSAAAVSNEASATTVADVQAPTAPSNLVVAGSTVNGVSLSWGTSTDNVGVTGYDIYVNGAKAYTVASTQTSFTVYGLTHDQSYAFTVKAKDLAGNSSPASNQVSGEALINGLSYSYYNNLPTTTTVLPNFGTLTPVSSGFTSNVNLTSPPPPPADVQFYAYYWTGYLYIPTAGTYYLRTSSDDGSRLWLGSLNSTVNPYTFSGTPTINNDKLQGTTAVSSSALNLQVGFYPITIAYFNGTGGFAMSIAWRTPASGTTYVTVPNSAFQEPSVTNGTVPNAPSNLLATALSYKAIRLQWKDNSTNETGFEIYRSTSVASGYSIIGTTGAAATSYTDSTATATTKYYYQVRAINLYGSSAFTSNYTEAEFKFNNNYIDSTGNGYSLTAISTPTFDASTKKEGAYAVKLNGTNQAITINNTNGSVTNWLQEAYTQRTVALWVKSSVATGTNKVILDLGGSDDGLALLLSSNTLTAAVASNNVRASISTTIVSTDWNHVAVVYSGDSLLLYVNGVLKASNTALSFHAMTTTTNGHRIGQTNGTNAFNTTGTFFGGWIDDLGVYNTALGTDVINTLMNFSYGQSNAITLALPVIPTAPASLTVTAVSAAQVNLGWQDLSTNETSFQVYRSNNNNQNYFLLATLPAGTVSYKDSGLFANAKYYYKVNALNAGGTSGYSNEGNATTLDVPPVIGKLSNQQARYGTTTIIPVSATTVFSAPLSLTGLNLPAFAQVTNNGNNTGKLTLTPAASDAGTYQISVVATDAAGGADTTRFTLAINNNYAPTLDTLVSYTMNEGDSLNIALNGHNVNAGDTMTLVVNNVPAGYTLTQGTNGTGTLTLRPGFAGAGTYNVTVTVNDNNGLSVSRSFGLVVNNVEPLAKIYTRFTAGDAVGAPWNSISGSVTSNLVDSKGVTTPVGLTVTPTWWYATSTDGTTTGNNSGIYPDAVMHDYFYFGNPWTSDVINAYFWGLDTTKKYNLTFFSSSSWSGSTDNGKTSYTIGNQSVTLAVQANKTNTVGIGGVKPAADGTIMIAIGKVAGSPAGVVNAMIIGQQYDDGTAPAVPTSLQGTVGAGNVVSLTWPDVAYNEDNYIVYRSIGDSVSFAPIATLPMGATSYADTPANGNTLCFYKVKAVNVYGSSPYTNNVSLRTANRIPTIAAIPNAIVNNNQTLQVNVSAADDPTDHLTLTASGLPAFASFVDNGNGTGVVTIQPTAGMSGTFPGATITATDLSDSSTSATFTINVVDPNLRYTYVNFTTPAFQTAAPWNNFVIPYLPYATMNFVNLADQTGTPTGITATLTDAWDNFFFSGMKRRNGSDLYPESVAYNALVTTGTANHRITLTGMDVSKSYNIQFFASHSTSENSTTNYTIGSKTVSMNACMNSNKTVQINGVTPDASGTLVINVQKDASAIYGMLSAIVIESYTAGNAKPFSPADLRVLDYAKSNTISLQWQDRADSETGYEVWRANDGAASYSLLKSLPAGTTSYVDSALPNNTAYNYTVRAVNGTNYSAYSNAVKGYTYANTVFVNLNNSTSPNPGAPFNSLNWVYRSLGIVWNNFKDETGLPTNIGMAQIDNWDEVETNGYVTGNATGHNPGQAGIFPDKALIQSFLNFVGNTSTIQVTGLDLSKTYDFTLMGSVSDDNTQNSTSKYTINGKTTLLNAHFNNTGTVTMFGITPDQNGTVNITVTAYDSSNSSFSVLGVLIIKGYNPSTNGITTPPVSTIATTNAVTATASQLQTATTDDDLTVKVLSAYPNPFKGYFNLSVPADDNDNVLVQLTDASGKVVYVKSFAGLVKGNNTLSIEPGTATAPGVYFVKVVYTNKNIQKVLRVVSR